MILHGILEGLQTKIRGFQGVLVMDEEGVPVHQVGAPGADVELWGAEIALILQLFREAARDLRLGELQRLSLLGEGYQAHIGCLKGGCLLGCLTTSVGAFGATRHRLQGVSSPIQAVL